MYDRILTPTDGSEGSAHVALQAIDLAEQYGATVHALYVVEEDVRTLLSGASGSTSLDKQGQRAVDRVTQLASAHGVEAVSEIREGRPAAEILGYADEIDADAIVAGTHGRSGIERRVIGSVAERLVRHASCPVMTIRLPDTDVTVDSENHAEELAVTTLEADGYAPTVTGVRRQQRVWVVEVDAEGESLVVYIDPVTQRTSVVER